MTTPTSYQKDLIESLKDHTEAAAYLNAAIEEGDRAVFLLTLRNVVEANGGMAKVAGKQISAGRTCTACSPEGVTRNKSLLGLLRAMGFKLSIEAEAGPSSRRVMPAAFSTNVYSWSRTAGFVSACHQACSARA